MMATSPTIPPISVNRNPSPKIMRNTLACEAPERDANADLPRALSNGKSG
jgi:hypothetical protein